MTITIRIVSHDVPHLQASNVLPVVCEKRTEEECVGLVEISAGVEDDGNVAITCG